MIVAAKRSIEIAFNIGVVIVSEMQLLRRPDGCAQVLAYFPTPRFPAPARFTCPCGAHAARMSPVSPDAREDRLPARRRPGSCSKRLRQVGPIQLVQHTIYFCNI
jgi:hypothetical protein